MRRALAQRQRSVSTHGSVSAELACWPSRVRLFRVFHGVVCWKWSPNRDAWVSVQVRPFAASYPLRNCGNVANCPRSSYSRSPLPPPRTCITDWGRAWGEWHGLLRAPALTPAPLPQAGEGFQHARPCLLPQARAAPPPHASLHHLPAAKRMRQRPAVDELQLSADRHAMRDAAGAHAGRAG